LEVLLDRVGMLAGSSHRHLLADGTEGALSEDELTVRAALQDLCEQRRNAKDSDAAVLQRLEQLLREFTPG